MDKKLPLIIDTDAGFDDLMAIAFLLSSDVEIECITLVHGLAETCHVGQSNIKRICALAERGGRSIPVLVGAEKPLDPIIRSFPDKWKVLSLDSAYVVPQSDEKKWSEDDSDAVGYLINRFSDFNRPVRVLCLGPLTNIALALEGMSGTSADKNALQEVMVMGGAIYVPGNLVGGGRAPNDAAEWNIYCDPAAARIFFARFDIRRFLVPLDATNKVPLSEEFVAKFIEESDRMNALGKLIVSLFTIVGIHVEGGEDFYAWDMLAACALIDATLLTWKKCSIVVEVSNSDGSNEHIVGQTKLIAFVGDDALGCGVTSVAIDASADRFRDIFISAFMKKERN